MGIFFKIISMLAFGASHVFWKKLPKSAPVYQLIFWRTVYSCGIFLALYSYKLIAENANLGVFKNFVAFSNWYINDLLLGAVLCFYSFLGLVFYNLSIKEGTISNAAIVTSTSTIFGVCVALAFYNESLKLSYILAFLFFLGGLLILQKGALFKPNKEIAYALCAAFVWGTSFALLPYFSRKYGPLSTGLLLELMVLIGAAAISLGKKERMKEKPKQSLFFLLGFFAALGVFMYNLSMDYADVSLLSILGILSPLASVVLAMLILKEPLSKRTALALVLSILGLAVLRG